MKELVLMYLLMISVNVLIAQSWCDSTLIVCDSVVVDSILFTHSAANGDRVHVAITSNHDLLYAPNFVLCPSDGAIAFVSNEHSYFSLFGPASVLPYYEFENFEIVGDSLIGNVIVDNTNNGFEDCIVSFRTAVPAISTGLVNDLNNSIEVFPNPANDFVTVKTKFPDQIQHIFLVDNLGKRHPMSVVSERIDISEMLPGVYLICLEMRDKQNIVKKIVIH